VIPSFLFLVPIVDITFIIRSTLMEIKVILNGTERAVTKHQLFAMSNTESI